MTEFWNKTIENLRNGPLGPIVRWIDTYPRLSAWIFLAVGMVIILVIEAWNVGLLPGQWVALIIATILVAGACVWIISFEDDEEEALEAAESSEDSAE